MARTKAPAGGAVVNQNFQEGGQFMAKALKNIRSVAEKLVRLARPEDERTHDALLHAVRENPLSPTPRLAFADFLQEQGQPGAHVVGAHGEHLQTTGQHPSSAVVPAHLALNVNLRSGTHPVVHLNEGQAFVSPGGIGILSGQEQSPLAQLRYYGSLDRKGKTQPVPGALPVVLGVVHRTPEATENQLTGHSILSIAHLHNIDDFRKYTADFPKEARKALLKQFVKHLLPDQRKVKLARPEEERKALPGSAFTGAEVGHSDVKPLTIRELKDLEAQHGIAKTKLLSNRVKPQSPELGEESPFTANKAHVAAFINELTNKRLVGHPLRKALADPSKSDSHKLAYLGAHLGTEAREFTDATQANGSPEWYGSHVDAYEHAMHNAFGFKPNSPEMTIIKALTAATSSSTNPKTNGKTVYRMIRQGMLNDPKNPFLGIPAYDHETLQKYREALAQKNGGKPVPKPGYSDVRGGQAPHQEAAWYMKYVHPNKELWKGKADDEDGVPIGYRSRPAVVVDRPGHPDHGKLVQYTVNDEPVLTAEGGALFNRHRLKKALRKVDIPDTQENGELRPKGWNARPSQVESGLGRIQALVKDLGVKGAQDWLLREHPIEEFQKRFGYTPQANQIGVDAGSHLPGMFVLGPKFGAFALNLHANTPEGAHHAKWLTADLWWSRTWNRMMGTLFTGAKKEDGHVDAPRGPKERKWMAQAAERATKAAGLRNVAELQAVIWYYEQSLWRMLGVKAAKSYSFLDASGAITAQHARDTGTNDLPTIAKRYQGVLEHVAGPGKWSPEQRKAALMNFLRETIGEGLANTKKNRAATEAKANEVAVKLARKEAPPRVSGLQALDALAARLKAQGRMPSPHVLINAILSAQSGSEVSPS